MLQPGDKKALTVLGAIVVAALVILAGVTTVLVRGHDEPVPAVSLQAGDRLVRMESGFWCSLQMSDCVPDDPRTTQVTNRIYHAPAPIGERVLLTVPHDVAAGVWTLVAEFATPRGLQRVLWIHPRDSMYTQELRSEPGRVLTAVEVSALSAVSDDPQGIEAPGASLYVRGTFSANTAPDGFRIPNETQLPDMRG